MNNRVHKCRECDTLSNSINFPAGTLWTTKSGRKCEVVAVERKGVESCDGCAYLLPNGQVECHHVPACKWWTREDRQNIIYKPINQ